MNNGTELKEWADDREIELIFWDDMDDAVIGLAECDFRNISVVSYSYTKLLEILIENGLEYIDALEHISVNMAGGWLGDKTPIIIDDRMLSN
jgi:hypothetical protein